ncbi:MAG: hypothetical protein KDC46_11080 [Thermoleophilia bacterium]|nr:hypothetical protein [Thermoleophilia bacterium]
MSIPPFIEPRDTDRSNDARAPRRVDLRLLAWPTMALALLVTLAIWRSGSDGQVAASVAPTLPLATRSLGSVRLAVPKQWRVLDRSGEDRITWGEPQRGHVVTLASTEASAAPLVSIVRDVARESESAMDGVSVTGGPTIIEPGVRMPREDSVVQLRLRAETPEGPVDVVQSWRRDSRAGLDIVATWTSTDGRWPVDPRDAIPTASAR